MNTSEIKKLVTKFRREFGIRDVTAESLEGAFRKQGFTIIDFNSAVNDPDVTTVIDSLGLQGIDATGFRDFSTKIRCGDRAGSLRQS